jgi:hypothetical protein
MQNVPKIVSERLRATPPVVDHPDADVLTAFAERSLSEQERLTVFGHLARCGDCRDIVALALPAIEPTQTVIAPAHTGWLTWPALRWGFVAAGIVAVASFGIVQYQHQLRSSTTVAKEVPSETTATQSQDTNNIRPTIPTEKTRETTKLPTNALSASAPATAAPVQPPLAKLEERQIQVPAHLSTHLPKNGAAIGGPVVSVFARKMQAPSQQMAAAPQQNADTAANLKIPTAAQTVEVSGAAPGLDTVPTQPSQLNTEASNLGPVSSQQSSSMFDEDTSQQVSRAKSAVSVANGAAVANVIPRWGISSTGTLQRSFDQGNTWQDVNVTANLASTGVANFARRAWDVRVEQKKADNTDKSVPAPPVPTSPVFRAVAATGVDVWAGGSGGALYHSLDVGNHWRRVIPSASGATLTGDVIRMEFTDAQHGTITTSTPETWITGDDGLTWQKQ